MHRHLTTYLQDHRAGARGALDLLDKLAEAFGTTDVGALARDLREEIGQEAEQVDTMLQALEAEPDTLKQAAAWISEKLSRVKLDATDDDLGLLESLEALSIGVWGKRALWNALDRWAPETLRRTGIDFKANVDRSQDQWERLEEARLAASRRAFLV